VMTFTIDAQGQLIITPVMAYQPGVAGDRL
jgi:hypothetical protein